MPPVLREGTHLGDSSSSSLISNIHAINQRNPLLPKIIRLSPRQSRDIRIPEDVLTRQTILWPGWRRRWMTEPAVRIAGVDEAGPGFGHEFG